MKRIFFLTLLFSYTFISFGQLSEGLSIVPIINDAEYYLNRIENDYYKISKVEFDLVHSDSPTYCPIKLMAGQKYNILLYGERDKVNDIDLDILDPDWKVIERVNNSTNILETTFIPESNAYYEFGISAQSFKSDYTSGRYFIIVSFDAYDQSSIIPIYNQALEGVKVFENEGYEIVHLDLNILTEEDNSENSRRYFDAGYQYRIAALSDENISSLNLDLYVDDNNDWKYVNSGEPFEGNNNLCWLDLEPTETKSYLIDVKSNEFAPNATSGRFFFLVGNKSSMINLNIRSRAGVRYNSSNERLTEEDPVVYNGTFSIDLNTFFIQKNYNNITTNYSLVEVLSTAEEIDSGSVLFTVQDDNGTKYLVQIDITNANILFLQATDRNYIYTGYRYYLYE